MKSRKIALLLACLLAVCLAGCKESPATDPESGQIEELEEAAGDSLSVGTISRSPKPGTDFIVQWQESRGLEEILTPDELGSIDLRCADLREADLSEMAELLNNASFDEQTKWPQNLPEGFDKDLLMELGKDPGLGVRELHQRGITGKGVGIAIIDQSLLVEHQEYADRLRLYQEYHTAAGDDASLHGPAVASIALGKTVGVAPEALLYYIADDVGTGTTDENFVRDMTYYAQDIDRLIALNEKLPEDEKIRIISMSVGYMGDDLGAKEMDEAVSRARAAGIAVMMVNGRDSLMGNFMGMGREPYSDPNDIAGCRPGQYWESMLYSGEYERAEDILIPMDHRTLAAQTGAGEYVHTAPSGASWTIPYVAGLYALACQVKPDVTFEEFIAAAKETAVPVTYSHEGKEYPYGRVVNPIGLIDTLEK